MAKARPLTEDLQKVAIEELNEVPERLDEDIEALCTWIVKQPYLKARTSDQFLLAFLRGCKFSLEKAKSKIDKYYALRTKYPELFTIRKMTEERVVELIKLGIGLHLPTPLHENGPRILLIRGGGYSVDKYSFDEIMCMAHGLQEISMLEDDYAIVNGVVNVMDMSLVTAAHLLQITPSLMKKTSTYAEEALPFRQKTAHFIHTPKAFDALFNTLKLIIPTKQQERNLVHGDRLEDLYKYVPQKYLPKEYGGENGSIDEIIAKNVEVYLKYRDYFAEDINYGTDEKLRPGAPVDYDGIFGIDGSFRKLNVD